MNQMEVKVREYQNKVQKGGRQESHYHTNIRLRLHKIEEDINGAVKEVLRSRRSTSS